LTPKSGVIESSEFSGHAIFRDNPFEGIQGNYQVVPYRAGATVQEIVDQAVAGNQWIETYIEVRIGDSLVTREHWKLVRLKKDAPIVLVVRPQGGKVGNILKTVALIAIAVVASVYLGPLVAGAMGFTAGTTSFLLASALTAAAITMAGSLALNAIFPPPSLAFPSLGLDPAGPGSGGSGGGSREADSFGWSVNKNSSNQYGAVPRVYGRVKMAPNYAARPYVTSLGDKQTLYMLFDFGYGPLMVQDLRIGDNPIDSFQGVEYAVHQRFKKGDALSFYTRDVYQTDYSQKLLYNGWRSVEGGARGSEFILDISAPQGLAVIDKNTGNLTNKTVDLMLQYRAKDESWVNFTAAGQPITISGPGYVYDRPMTFSKYWEATTGWYSGAPNSNVIDYLPPVDGYAPGSFISVKRTRTEWVANSQNTGGGDNGWAGGDNGWSGGGSGNGDVGGGWWGNGGEGTDGGDGDNWDGGWNSGGNSGGGRSAPTARSGPVTRDGGYYATIEEYTDYITRQDVLTTDKVIRLSGETQRPLHVSITFNLAEYEYEFRLARVDPDSDDRYVADDVYLSAIRAIRNVAPIAPEVPHTILELRILATDQLNGMIDTLTAVVTSILPVWENGVWTEYATRNPAWAYLDVLRGTGSIKPAAESRLDLESFLEWARFCDAPAANFPAAPKSTCDMVISGDSTTWFVLKTIASTGDATPSLRAGKYSISVDRLRDFPVQLFTPRNSSGFSSSITYYEHPHALRVQFVDPQQQWQARELIVFDDGYSEANATKYQTLELVGITTAHQAYRIGRRSIAQAKLRSETFTIETGMENILATRGDLVRLAYDVAKIGAGYARVKSIAGNRVTFDDLVVTVAGDMHARFRVSNSKQTDLQILAVVDEYTLEFASIPAEITVGQLAVFGQLERITMDCLVKSIKPSMDLKATLELVPYAPAIYKAEVEPIPPYNPLITELGDMRPGPVINLTAAEFDTVIARFHYISISLSWTQPAGVLPSGYAVYEVQGDKWIQIGTTKSLTYFAYKDVKAVSDNGEPIDMVGRPLTFAVVAIGYSGERLQPGDAPQTTIVAVGDRVKPLAPEYFDLDIRSKESIYLEWSESRSNDVSHYVVRYSPRFEGADFHSATIIASRQPYASTSLTVPARLGTYFVKTVDTFGNVSEGSIMAITPTATLTDDIELLTLEDAYWDGTINGMEAVAKRFLVEWPILAEVKPTLKNHGYIQSITLPDGTYAPSGIYNFKETLDFRQIQPITFTAQIEAEAIVGGVAMDAALVGEQWDAWLELRAAKATLLLKDWPTLDNVEPNLLLGNAPFSPWRKFYAGEYTGQIFQFRLCVASRDPNIGIKINRASVQASARIRVDGDYDVQCLAAGLRVDFDPPYFETPALGITQDSAQQGDRAVVYAKDRFGFNIAFVDKDGVDVARQFDWIARGWGKEAQTLPHQLSTQGTTRASTARVRSSASQYMNTILNNNG
jgi:hypothetical protein